MTLSDSPMACSDWIISQEKFKSLNRGHRWCWKIGVSFVLTSLFGFFAFVVPGSGGMVDIGLHILPDMNRQNGTERNWIWASKQAKQRKRHIAIQKMASSQPSHMHCLLQSKSTFSSLRIDDSVRVTTRSLRQTESEEQPRLLLNTVDEQRHWCPMGFYGVLGGKDARVGDLTVVHPSRTAGNIESVLCIKDDLSIALQTWDRLDWPSHWPLIFFKKKKFWFMYFFIILSHGNYRKRPTISSV